MYIHYVYMLEILKKVKFIGFIDIIGNLLLEKFGLVDARIKFFNDLHLLTVLVKIVL